MIYISKSPQRKKYHKILNKNLFFIIATAKTEGKKANTISKGLIYAR